MIVRNNVLEGWIEVTTANGGTKSFIGWTRLETHLIESGELAENERIVQLEIGEEGLMYTVEKV